MKVRILESAKDDLREGWEFYESQSAGLGERFFDTLVGEARSLSLNAGIHEVVDGFHRKLSRRFPFAIYYRVSGLTVDVYAILDQRREPGANVSRLKNQTR